MADEVVRVTEATGGSTSTELITTTAKPGYQTTEFWLTLAAILVSLMPILQEMWTGVADAIPSEWQATLAAIAAVGYSFSRGLTKAIPAIVGAMASTRRGGQAGRSRPAVMLAMALALAAVLGLGGASLSLTGCGALAGGGQSAPISVDDTVKRTIAMAGEAINTGYDLALAIAERPGNGDATRRKLREVSKILDAAQDGYGAAKAAYGLGLLGKAEALARSAIDMAKSAQAKAIAIDGGEI